MCNQGPVHTRSLKWHKWVDFACCHRFCRLDDMITSGDRSNGSIGLNVNANSKVLRGSFELQLDGTSVDEPRGGASPQTSAVIGHMVSMQVMDDLQEGKEQDLGAREEATVVAGLEDTGPSLDIDEELRILEGEAEVCATIFAHPRFCMRNVPCVAQNDLT